MVKPFKNANGEIELEYYNADHFVPVSWNSATITEADFHEYIDHNNKKFLRVEAHRLNTFTEKDEEGVVVATGADGRTYQHHDGDRNPSSRQPVWQPPTHASAATSGSTSSSGSGRSSAFSSPKWSRNSLVVR